MSSLGDEITPPGGELVPLPWPSAFELEIKARLNDLESHQNRIDRLLIEIQGDIRRAERAKAERDARIEAKVDSLVALLRSSGANGHD